MAVYNVEVQYGTDALWQHIAGPFHTREATEKFIVDRRVGEWERYWNRVSSPDIRATMRRVATTVVSGTDPYITTQYRIVS